VRYRHAGLALSCSRLREDGDKGLAVLRDDVDGDERLAHEGDEGDLWQLAVSEEALAEVKQPAATLARTPSPTILHGATR
jgi:hypothetical protein